MTLLCAYGCDGVGDEVTDSSGNGHHGTIESGTRVPGYFGGAINFVAANPDRCSLPAETILPLAGGFAITGMCWLRPLSYTNDDRLVTWALTNYSYETDLMFGFDTNHRTFRVQLRFVNNTFRVEMDCGDYPFGTWQHFAWKLEAGDIHFYRNGVSYGNLYINHRALHEDLGIWPGYIGNVPTMDRPFNGDIDEIKLFSTALSESEIQDEMVTPINPVGPAFTSRLALLGAG